MKITKIAISSDHAAFEQKAVMISFLHSHDIEVLDFGTNSKASCHYPQFVFPLVDALKKSESTYGILLCGTGIGVSMVANRFSNIRAALCRSTEEAKLTRQHNDANVLCLGARINTVEELKEIVLSFIKEDYEGGRHQKRLDLFNRLGESNVPKK